MILARPIRKLVESFEKLPGIGPKTASRLAFYLLHVPQGQLDDFADNLSNLKKQTVFCSLCFNIAETDPCPVCRDPARDQKTLCIVETPLDVLALEKTGGYRGLYHVLHGAISPLNNIGPEELHFKEIFPRLINVEELILATNPNMEGEATAMYLRQKLKAQDVKVKTTRLGIGLPTGGDLEYADENTLKKALEGRREY
ncbi:MAG: recombination mediator RecR [Candidatus Shapirobacteria bacterium]